MNKMIKKILFNGILLMALLFSFNAYAEIFTKKTGGGNAESIYVAGNPSLYPIEYYDSDSDCYKGLIPDVLNYVSEKTGLDFTYISAGTDNRQASLCKNNQVELVTAITYNQHKFEDMEKAVVLKTEIDGEKTEYCIGFTNAITENNKESIINALAEIPQSYKVSLLVENANNDYESSHNRTAFIVIVVFAFMLAVVITAIIVRLHNKRKDSKINRLIDANTGVGNEAYYAYAFNDLMGEHAKNLYNLAYIAFDTKVLVEQNGDVAVDTIEKYAAAKLSKYLTDSEYLSRIGNGTFALLFQAENNDIAEKRLCEISDGVNQYIRKYANISRDIFKIGYCRFCDNSGIDAETALYNAKQGYLCAVNGDLPYCMGLKEYIEADKKTKKLASQVDKALKDNEFKIYMQLLYDCKKRAFCGAEVLSRWQNSEYGLLRPNDYIDILSKTGKIVQHDYIIFEEVCAMLEKWSMSPFDKLFLSCNFTRLSVSNADFVKNTEEISGKYNFSHSRLVIEITENTLSDNRDIVSKNIYLISKMGFRVAIDDMGAGFSSLADIYDNEIDIVKIERDFLSSCDTNRRRQMLCNIITLVHNAGAKVICEGVENADQLEMLKNIGCDITQGYYHSRVLPVNECEKLLS